MDTHPIGDQEVAGLDMPGRQHSFMEAGLGGSVGCMSDWFSGGCWFDWLDQQNSFIHELFSRVILSLPLIQDGQLSVSGKRMYTNTG